MSHRHAIALAAIAGALSVGATPAAAKTLQVDDDHAQCPKAAFTSVQAAVTAAQPGDKVQVCPGTYTEQVRITNKDGLKLEAQKKGQATIKFPVTTTLPNALVHIQSSDRVDVRGFVISGPYGDPSNNACAAPGPERSRGVYVDNSDEATIAENRITMIRNANPALWGCQNGIAVQIGRQFESSVGDADLSHNVIDLYEKGGVVVDNAGSDAEIDHNTISATPEAQSIVAANGVQISRGATAHVWENTISLNSFTPATFTGAGILVFQADGSDLKIDHNEMFANDDGFDILTTDGAEISDNYSHDNVFDGFFADTDTANNLFKSNRAFGNGQFDCQDDSPGPANIWKNDRGNTASPPQICQPK